MLQDINDFDLSFDLLQNSVLNACVRTVSSAESLPVIKQPYSLKNIPVNDTYVQLRRHLCALWKNWKGDCAVRRDIIQLSKPERAPWLLRPQFCKLASRIPVGDWRVHFSNIFTDGNVHFADFKRTLHRFSFERAMYGIAISPIVCRHIRSELMICCSSVIQPLYIEDHLAASKRGMSFKSRFIKKLSPSELQRMNGSKFDISISKDLLAFEEEHTLNMEPSIVEAIAHDIQSSIIII
ncbi:hypothetical protein GJ496_000733 [Pomphorhynchus laevis]|nr:hypothetical protein GJ496_000733 [Pomphorhynchus laevis]